MFIYCQYQFQNICTNTDVPLGTSDKLVEMACPSCAKHQATLPVVPLTGMKFQSSAGILWVLGLDGRKWKLVAEETAEKLPDNFNSIDQIIK